MEFAKQVLQNEFNRLKRKKFEGIDIARIDERHAEEIKEAIRILDFSFSLRQFIKETR